MVVVGHSEYDYETRIGTQAAAGNCVCVGGLCDYREHRFRGME